MTLIRIDPDELTATAETLRRIAAELTQIGTSVATDVACCVLPDGDAATAASQVNGNLGSVGGDLATQATDLTNRGALAANQSLPTAASAASGPAAPMTVDESGGLTGGWIADMEARGATAPTTGFVGGGNPALGQMTIVPASGVDPANWLSSMDATTGSVGGPTSYTALRALDGATWDNQQARADMRALAAGTLITGRGPTASMLPASMSGLPTMSSIQDGINSANRIWTVTSRDSILASGRDISLSDYHNQYPGGFDGYFSANHTGLG